VLEIGEVRCWPTTDQVHGASARLLLTLTRLSGR
jgi:hypothetical protein